MYSRVGLEGMLGQRRILECAKSYRKMGEVVEVLEGDLCGSARLIRADDV